jgi:hypothetical protein
VSAALGGQRHALRLTSTLTANDEGVVTVSTTGEKSLADVPLRMAGLPANRSASVLAARTTRAMTAKKSAQLVAPVAWTYLETSEEQRAIRENAAVVDWLYTHRQTAASLTQWRHAILWADQPLDRNGHEPATLPAFIEPAIPSRPR